MLAEKEGGKPHESDKQQAKMPRLSDLLNSPSDRSLATSTFLAYTGEGSHDLVLARQTSLSKDLGKTGGRDISLAVPILLTPRWGSISLVVGTEDF